MGKKIITIIICSYNNSSYLKECHKSFFDQSVSNNWFDVILVDDKSSDESFEIANYFKDKKNFRIIKNKKNIGLVKSCNKAIKYVKTDFMVRVDSDDYVSKNFVKVFLKNIEKGYEFILSNYTIVTNNRLKRINIKKFRFKDLISCSVALKIEIINKIGGYNNFLWEEYDLYIRYLRKSKKIFRTKKYLYFYRLHKTNMTKLSSWKKRAWKQLFKRHEKKVLEDLERSIALL